MRPRPKLLRRSRGRFRNGTLPQLLTAGDPERWLDAECVKAIPRLPCGQVLRHLAIRSAMQNFPMLEFRHSFFCFPAIDAMIHDGITINQHSCC